MGNTTLYPRLLITSAPYKSLAMSAAVNDQLTIIATRRAPLSGLYKAIRFRFPASGEMDSIFDSILSSATAVTRCVFVIRLAVP